MLPIFRDLVGRGESHLNAVRIIDERAIWTLFRAPEDRGRVNQPPQYIHRITGCQLWSQCLEIALNGHAQNLFARGSLCE
jgi:hypothetical protein